MTPRTRREITDGKSCPTGTGTTDGYMVEVRYNYVEPKMVGGLLLGKEWKKLYPHENDKLIGVPRPKYRRRELDLAGLLNRHEAEAFRWWFICLAESQDDFPVCLETRIVEYRLEYSFSATPIAVVDALDWRGDEPKNEGDFQKSEHEDKERD